MIKLCVNIDHVATVRQARGGQEPDPVAAAVLCELAGAQGITFHLREDRRHIQERDIKLLTAIIQVKLNMEMANTKEMLAWAKEFKPQQVTFVPEKRQELTTEGGLNVAANLPALKSSIAELQHAGIETSLFIAPDEKQLAAAASSGARAIEIHTGEYANAKTEKNIVFELKKIEQAAQQAHAAGLKVFAGHGLHYQNISNILSINYLEEVNIGHSIISRAVFIGISRAVKEMLGLISKTDEGQLS